MINLIYDENDPSLPEEAVLDLIKKAAALIAESENAADGEVSLSFASPDEIMELNDAYRGQDRVTDVLSFPQMTGDEAVQPAEPVADMRGPDEQDIPMTYGDVVICPVRAARQAEEYNHSIEREIVYLFVHGMFHLLGYDHKSDDARSKMRKAEEEVLSKLDLSFSQA